MPPKKAADILARMLKTLQHEPFYTTGTWIDEGAGLYVGWTAHEGSFSDGMPLRNEKGDAVLVFSGEEYPEPATAERLKEQGHDIDPSGPSYLIHLAEEDSEFPARLNGRFHGLLADSRRGTVLLFNDRYGMHRIYYHESKEAFYFAAEAKAILAVCPELRRIDPQSLGEFLACGVVMEDRTLFSGVRLLPPGSAWVFRSGSLERKANYFYSREWEEQEPLNYESFYRQLRETFARNLSRYFHGHQRIAMSLTGGLDTRMIMAWRKPAPDSLPCYTFGGMRRDCQDVRVARKVARACGQPYRVLPVGQDFLTNFSRYAERVVYLTDGSVEVSRGADLYLNSIAREIAAVRMTGNYGGEVLRKVRIFKPSDQLPGFLNQEILRSFVQARDTYREALRGHPLSFTLFKQAPNCFCGWLTLDETQLTLRAPFFDNDFVRTVFRAPESALASSDVSVRLIADGNNDLLKIPTDRGMEGTGSSLIGAVSQALLELLFKAEYAYDMGMPQWLAGVDHVLSPLQLDRLFLGRHKIFHYRLWYRNDLGQYIREMLLDRRSLSRSYVERKELEAMVRGHLKGNRNYTGEIHKALTLEIIHRTLLEGAYPAARVATPPEPKQMSVA